MKKIKILAFAVLFIFFTAAAWGETFIFRADRMYGARATGREIIVLSGNAEVRSDNLFLQADRIEIHGENNRFIDCIGNVRGHDEERNIFFTTDRLRYDRTLKIARLEGNSTMEDRDNEILARARFIEFDEEREIAVMQISVRLFRNNLTCRAEHVVYRRQEQILDLSGFPVVFRNDDEYRADRIRVDLETDDVIMHGAVRGTLRN